MLGLGALGQYPLGGGPFGNNTVVTIGWFAPLSEPARFKIGLAPQAQQFIAYQPMPSPFAPTGWFMPLSEPVRTRPRSHAAEVPFIAYQPMPSPFVATGWFMPLSEPVRTKKGLRPQEQQFSAFQPAPSPFVATGWFMPLSEPVRFPIGLKAARQQFLAAPSRLLPTPNLFATMAATETADIFVGSSRFWNRIFSGEAGVISNADTGGQIGIQAVPANLTSAGTIPETFPTPAGVAELPPFRASVSVRMV